MSYIFRPPIRQTIPLVIGIAGPTKSGKTYSAHRLAVGLAGGKPVAVVNAEGPKGHQYVERFTYLACDLTAPFRPSVYTDVLRDVAKIEPGVVIMDSASHMHDGPGGMLEWHKELCLDMARGDAKRAEKMKAVAWVTVREAENQFIYQMGEMKCHLILCFRAKEKIKITKSGEWIELGWQPIAAERVAFETIFTLMLPPHSKGVPDLDISDMREPFDTMVPVGKPIDENLGRALAKWSDSRTSVPAPPTTERPGRTEHPPDDELARERSARLDLCKRVAREQKWTRGQWEKAWSTACGAATETNVDPSALADLERSIKTSAQGAA